MGEVDLHTTTLPLDDEKQAGAERRHVIDGGALIGMIASAISGAIMGSLVTLIICSLW